MKYLRYSIIIIGLLTLVSCTDQWHEEQSQKLLVKYDWTLTMYVDGVQNEVVSVGEMRYRFKADGTFVKETQSEDLQTTSWDMPH
jgi:hypothetical protein